MNNTSAILATLKSYNGLAASLSTFVPVISIFTDFAPPFLENAGILSAGIGAAIIVVVSLRHPKRMKRRQEVETKSQVRKAIAVLAAGSILTVGYFFLFDRTTITDPSGSMTLQTGLGLFEWNLTPKALMWIQSHPNTSRFDLMMSLGGYAGTDRIWQGWAVDVCGLCLILLFIFASSCWVLGFSLLATQSQTEGVSRE